MRRIRISRSHESLRRDHGQSHHEILRRVISGTMSPLSRIGCRYGGLSKVRRQAMPIMRRDRASQRSLSGLQRNGFPLFSRSGVSRLPTRPRRLGQGHRAAGRTFRIPNTSGAAAWKKGRTITSRDWVFAAPAYHPLAPPRGRHCAACITRHSSLITHHSSHPWDTHSGRSS